ncbi:DUF3800 domain-containing protein [Cyclobacterium plantarum]|uniref:DUF3800 domain-containing protein n=1 Tax=Cyclobacterium plantarum TaxID=2716263 RepID=A0ABX0H879_9BACT|nr:DUF3800 domain-containing protein [Cyclobacterium plantarum]NHE56407.1 DUF3800 domain-containing protein [Cyclobacterium plantarum]
MEPSLKFIPHELDRIRLNCKGCGVDFKPNWLEDRGGPMLGRYNDKDGGYWGRSASFVPCSNCGEKSSIEIPTSDLKSRVHLFGDEAYRPIGKSGMVYCYSVVGASEPFLGEIEKLLIDIKKKLQPELPPTSWKIHMKNLWSGQQRKKIVAFENWNFDHVMDLINQVSQLFDYMGDKLFKANIALPGIPGTRNPKVGFSEYIRNEAYVLLMSTVVHQMTKLGGQPIIFFDAEKKSDSDIIIQKWAKDIFINTQNTLFFSFMSKGIEIPEPKFIQPGSTPLSELADFISFIMARYHFRIFDNKKPEIDPKLLGNVMYMTFSDNGKKLLYQTQTGYPWRMNYQR